MKVNNSILHMPKMYLACRHQEVHSWPDHQVVRGPHPAGTRESVPRQAQCHLSTGVEVWCDVCGWRCDVEVYVLMSEV